MRDVTESAVKAFWAGKQSSHRNTTITVEGDWVVMRLHGNAIARRRGTRLELSTAGWTTSTTRERLNGLLQTINAHVWIKNGTMYATGRNLDIQGSSVELGDDWTVVRFETPAEQLANVVFEDEA